MISTDERADNLIARLFAYSPRRRERSELENYCTEALAWCLIISEPFAAKFLAAIRESSSRQIAKHSFLFLKVHYRSALKFRSKERTFCKTRKIIRTSTVADST